MNKYEITTQKKKTAIIDSTLKLFNRKGFTDTTIKEIATSANVSQVSIYNYFGSKEALVAECAKVVIADTLDKANAILKMDIDFTDKLERALSLSTSEINLSVSKHFTDIALSDPILLDLLIKSINKDKAKLSRDFIELGKCEGVIDKTIPTEIYVNFIEALNVMGSQLEFNDDTATNISHIHHLFLYGIMGKNEKSP